MSQAPHPIVKAASESLAASGAEYLARAQATAARLDSIVAVLPFASEADESRAADLLRVLTTVAKEGEDLRTALKAPFLEAGRAVDDAFRGPRASLDRVTAALRRRIGEAALARETARKAALAAAASAAQAQDLEAANAALATVPATQVTHTGIGQVHTWELDAVEDLSQVPAAFLTLDMTRVREEIARCKKTGQEPRVPGLRFRREVKLTVRGVT